MLFMDACVSGPNTIFEDVQEIQPRCRITATTSQPHNELSTNAPFLEADQGGSRVGAGQGGGWGCGPEQLVAPEPWLEFTLDVSHWQGAHSVWPYSTTLRVLRRES